MIFLLRFPTEPKMEICCHIRTRAAQSWLFQVLIKSNRVYVAVCVLNYFPLSPLYNRLYVANFELLYPDFHGKISADLHSSGQPAVTFRLTLKRNTLNPFRISLLKSTFPWSSFFSRTSHICNRLPRGYFPGYYNLKLFKSRVNYDVPTYPHKLSLLICNHLPRVAPVPCTVWTLVCKKRVQSFIVTGKTN